MIIGWEQRFNPNYSALVKAYITLLGVPIVGLRIRARNIFSLVPKNRQYKTILDAGSGPGVITFGLGRRFPEAKVMGVDLREDAVSISNHIAKKIKADNIVFKTARVEELEQDNCFDLVVCVDILEHIEDDFNALKALFRLVSPGGLLLLHIPSLYRRYPVWKRSINFDVPSHVRPGYKPDEIKNKVCMAGFEILKIGYTYGFWETLANNLSYMITHAKMDNQIFYALAFPFLHLISLAGRKARPKKIGAGIFILCEKL